MSQSVPKVKLCKLTDILKETIILEFTNIRENITMLSKVLHQMSKCLGENGKQLEHLMQFIKRMDKITNGKIYKTTNRKKYLIENGFRKWFSSLFSHK